MLIPQKWCLYMECSNIKCKGSDNLLRKCFRLLGTTVEWPAAAVIPAPRVYTKVVVVKKLVAYLTIGWCVISCRGVSLNLCFCKHPKLI